MLNDDNWLCDKRNEVCESSLNLPDHETIAEWGCWEAEKAENFPELHGRESREIAAEKAGFGSEFTYRQARKVTEEAIPELVDAMDRGEISISAAAMAVSLPEEEQQEIMEEIDQGGKPSEGAFRRGVRQLGRQPGRESPMAGLEGAPGVRARERVRARARERASVSP